MSSDVDIENLCKRLAPILGKKASLLWKAYITSYSGKEKAETAGIIQHLGNKHLGSDVSNRTIHLPPPAPTDSAGEFHLGSIMYGKGVHSQLHITRADLMKHTGIFAITGAGKTNIGMRLLQQLYDAQLPFMVFDWKRSYRQMKHHESLGRGEIKIFSVGRDTKTPFHWNPLRSPPGVHAQTWLWVVAETLEKSHVSGQGVADVLIETLDTCFENFGMYDGTGEEYPTFEDAFESLSKKKYSGRRQLWQDSCNRILRTFTFGPASVSFNSRDPLKIEDLLNQPIIMELDQEMPKPLRIFFCELILRWIHLYRLGEGESKTLRHILLLEEAHNLFPQSSLEKQATNSLETIYREIRSFGEGLVCITQHPSLLPIYILGNCNTQIYLPLQHERDIRAARDALFLEYSQVKFLDYLNVGEGIVKIKGRVQPCHVQFPLVTFGGAK